MTCSMIWRKFLPLIILALVISACSAKNDRKQDPQRVKGIPEKAFWIGGADGGNWFFVHEVNNHRNNAFISIYNVNGSLIIKKNFMVVCRVDRPPIWIKDLEQQIRGFDGTKILLISPTGKEICWMQ